MAEGTCLVGKCVKPWVARGLCTGHYQSEKKAGRLENWPKTRPPTRLCACGCGQSPPNRAAKFIRDHGPKPSHESDVERFWTKVNKDGPVPWFAPHLEQCYEWTAHKDKRGYGRFGVGRKVVLAHNFAWSLEHALDPTKERDHMCRNTSCVRTSHLDEVPGRENRRRTTGTRQRRTVCPHGHEYTPENTFFDKDSRQRCLTCSRNRTREYQQRKRRERGVQPRW